MALFSSSKPIFLRGRLITGILSAMAATNVDYKQAKTIYEFTVNDIKGEVVSLEKYKGHVCIIVNVASKCGYTDNHYTELNELYDKYSETKGLRILGFPCNQFGSQEPGGNDEICEFAKRKKVNFDMFDKVDVNGGNAHPLWKFLKHKQGGLLLDSIKWNFTKFIVDKNGIPVARYGPNTSPKDLEKDLEKYW
ncbi:probable phospholipid hydroperoxide glutathione peroxidase isoform X1 [Coccinella septempunctata]|uniref:probable phospholipid hydroperoxide glutathione peroxidase isoform X1 n=2 Tax=Coccinella septempunctata TaxID=41139 RepID=UPI001D0845B5|nr:probable phospholipid hydroperoxide glutathione peroxidase isoform X1 [Coccinella septempunctata]